MNDLKERLERTNGNDISKVFFVQPWYVYKFSLHSPLNTKSFHLDGPHVRSMPALLLEHHNAI